MKPTELLKEEHRGIKVALKVLKKLVKIISDGETAEPELYARDLGQMLGFFQVFVDRCHHAKEEEILFRALADTGLPFDSGPIRVMLGEHASGRKLVAEMELSLKSFLAGEGKAAAADALVAAAERYGSFLTEHIDKEDNVLYPIADNRLFGSVQEKMPAELEKLEVERIGPGTHEQYHIMLECFKDAYLG